MRAFQFMGLLLIFQWCKQMGLFGSQENRKFYIVISDPFFQQMRIEGLLWFLSCGVFWNLIYLLIWILKQINNKCRERVCFMVLTWSLILWALVGMTVMLMLLSSVDESRDRAFFFFSFPSFPYLVCFPCEVTLWRIHCQSWSSLLFFLPLCVIFFVGLVVLTFRVGYLAQLWGNSKLLISFHSHQLEKQESWNKRLQNKWMGWGSSTFMEFDLEQS